MAHVTWNLVAYWSGMVRKIYETRTLEIRHLVHLFSKWSENLTEVSRPFPSVQLPLCQNESKYENEFRVQVFLSCRSTSFLYERFLRDDWFWNGTEAQGDSNMACYLANYMHSCWWCICFQAYSDEYSFLVYDSFERNMIQGNEWTVMSLSAKFLMRAVFCIFTPVSTNTLEGSNSCCGAVSNDCLILNPS